MKMDVLHCETVAGVTKELLMFVLTYDLVRLVMLEASGRQGVAVDRISFIDALRWLAESGAGATLGKLVVNRDRVTNWSQKATLLLSSTASQPFCPTITFLPIC